MAEAPKESRIRGTVLRARLQYVRDHGGEERLREVLSNLVSNAVKYSPDGGAIWVGGRADQTGVTVYVADQGIGIPPEEQARIFDRFHRVESGLEIRDDEHRLLPFGHRHQLAWLRQRLHSMAHVLQSAEQLPAWQEPLI